MKKIVSTLIALTLGIIFAQGATFTVTLTGNNESWNSATGSLRWAIDQANATGGADVIQFSVAAINCTGGGLPTVTEALTIDGSTAPGFAACAPTVVVSGSGWTNMTVTANNVTLRDISFNDFPLIFSNSFGHVIRGCRFNISGANATATSGNHAIQFSGVSNATIGGSTCDLKNEFGLGTTATGFKGIDIVSSSNNIRVLGNYFGTTSTGNALLGSQGTAANAVYVSASTNVLIRANVMTGSSVYPVQVIGGSNVAVSTNTIGLSLAGTTLLRSATGATHGIFIDGVTTARIDSNTVSGMLLGAGIFTQGTCNALNIRRNKVGVRLDGTVSASPDFGTRQAGIYVTSPSSVISIDDNIVCDNGNGTASNASESGIYVNVTSGAVGSLLITNNYAGVDKSFGIKGNDFAGIYVEGGSGLFTSIAITGNVTGGNGLNGTDTRKSHGIATLNLGNVSGGCTIDNNYVGVGTSNQDIGNYGSGIQVFSTSNFTISGNVIGFNKHATTIAGGWSGGGILLGTSASNGTIVANYIGETSGGSNIGNINPTNGVYTNEMAGITLEGASNITIGGTSTGLANIIKNNNFGIQMTNGAGGAPSNITIQGNTIASNTRNGIHMPDGTNDSNNNLIGGTSAGQGNTINNNGGDGIFIQGAGSVNNRIARNSIYCNTGRGVNLNYSGSAGNQGVPAPITRSVSGSSVTFDLSGTANVVGAIVEVFHDDPGCTVACGATPREGRTYLGTFTVSTTNTTGGAGIGRYTYTHGSALTEGIIATSVTLPGSGNRSTSEFSTCNILCVPPTGMTASVGTATVCITAGSVSVTGTLGTGGVSGVWSASPSTGTSFTDANSANTTFNFTNAGAYVLTWTVSGSGSCTATATANLNVSATPSTSAAGTDIPLCNTTAGNLNATAPTVGTGAWTVFAGTASVTTPSSRTSAFSITSGTTATFRWTVTNGACTSTDDVVVNITNVSTPIISTPPTQCVTSGSVALTASNTTGATGATWSVTPSGSMTGQSIGGATFNYTAAGNYVVTLQLTTGLPGCTASNTRNIQVDAAPSVSAAGTDIPLCNTNTGNLNATAPTVGTGAWSVILGTATVTTPSSRTSTFTVTSGTSATFRWTVSNGVCAASTDEVVVNITNVTTPIISTPPTQCVTSGSVALTASNTTGATGATWSVTPSGSMTGQSIGGATFNYTAAGNYVVTLQLTTGLPGCTASNTRNIQVDAAPSVSAAGTDIPLCNTNTGNLNATAPTVGTGAWSVTLGTATVTTPSSRTSTFTVTAGTSATFRWTVSNGVCAASTDEVVVNITNVTTPAISDPGTQCVTNGSAVLTSSNTAGATGATWSVTPSGSMSGQSIGGATFNYSAAGNYTVTLQLTTGLPGCNASITRDIQVDAAPTVSSAGADQDLCNSSTGSLSANAPSVGTGLWTVTGGVATLTNAADRNAGFTITTAPATFTWTISNGACTASFASVDVSVTNVATPVIEAVADQCITSGSVGLTASNTTGANAAVWSVSPSGASISGGTLSGATLDFSSVGSYTVTLQLTTPLVGCTSSASAIVNVVNQPVADAGSDFSICAFTGNLSASGSGVWTITSGDASLANATSATSAFQINSGTSATFLWTVGNGSCTASSSVTVGLGGFSSPVITGPGFACPGSTLTYSVIDNGNTYNWSVSGDITIVSAVANSVTVTFGQNGGFVTLDESNGPCSAGTSIEVRASGSNYKPDAGDDITSCASSVTLIGSEPLDGFTGTWSSLSGSIVFSPDVNNDTVNAGNFNNGANEIYYTITGGCGDPISDTVLVTFGLSDFTLTDLFGPADTACVGTVRNIRAEVVGGSGDFTFVWSKDKINPIAETKEPILTINSTLPIERYFVYVVDNKTVGCQSEIDSADIISVISQNLVVPNLITPNDDEKNDQLYIYDQTTGQELLPGANLTIVNRWGQQVYRAENYDNTWEAVNISDGVYYYILESGCGDEEYKGWVQILGNIRP